MKSVRVLWGNTGYPMALSCAISVRLSQLWPSDKPDSCGKDVNFLVNSPKI